MTRMLRNYVIYIEEGFSTLSLSCVVGTLKNANKVLGCDNYTWRLVSTKEGAVLSDSGVEVGSVGLLDLDSGEPPVGNGSFVVLLSTPSEHRQAKRLISWVRDCISRGAGILTSGEATKLLAAGGLLHGRRCAVHWIDFGAAVENYPSVNITRNFYEIDGPFHSCAGQMSIFDLMLRILGTDQGIEFVDRLGSFAMHGSFKTAGQRQVLPDHARLERVSSPLVQLVDLMSENIADPLPLKTLTRSLCLSRRQVERLFEKQVGISPKRYYLQLRLERARDLLRYSNMPVVEIAVATGFVSASHFSKTYKLHFGMVPIDTRRSSLSTMPDGLPYGAAPNNGNRDEAGSRADMRRLRPGPNKTNRDSQHLGY